MSTTAASRTSCSPSSSEPLEQSLTLSAPMCTDCAFEPYCGADPVFHHATMDDFVGHKAISAFCQRNMGVFTAILLDHATTAMPATLPALGAPMIKLVGRQPPWPRRLSSSAFWRSAALRTIRRPPVACLLADGEEPAAGFGSSSLAGPDSILRRPRSSCRRSGPPHGRRHHRLAGRQLDQRPVEEHRDAQQPAADRAMRQLLPDVLATAEGARRQLAPRPRQRRRQPSAAISD